MAKQEPTVTVSKKNQPLSVQEKTRTISRVPMFDNNLAFYTTPKPEGRNQNNKIEFNGEFITKLLNSQSKLGGPSGMLNRFGFYFPDSQTPGSLVATCGVGPKYFIKITQNQTAPRTSDAGDYFSPYDFNFNMIIQGKNGDQSDDIDIPPPMSNHAQGQSSHAYYDTIPEHRLFLKNVFDAMLPSLPGYVPEGQSAQAPYLDLTWKWLSDILSKEIKDVNLVQYIPRYIKSQTTLPQARPSVAFLLQVVTNLRKMCSGFYRMGRKILSLSMKMIGATRDDKDPTHLLHVVWNPPVVKTRGGFNDIKVKPEYERMVNDLDPDTAKPESITINRKKRYARSFPTFKGAILTFIHGNKRNVCIYASYLVKCSKPETLENAKNDVCGKILQSNDEGAKSALERILKIKEVGMEDLNWACAPLIQLMQAKNDLTTLSTLLKSREFPWYADTLCEGAMLCRMLYMDGTDLYVCQAPLAPRAKIPTYKVWQGESVFNEKLIVFTSANPKSISAAEDGMVSMDLMYDLSNMFRDAKINRYKYAIEMKKAIAMAVKQDLVLDKRNKRFAPGPSVKNQPPAGVSTNVGIFSIPRKGVLEQNDLDYAAQQIGLSNIEIPENIRMAPLGTENVFASINDGTKSESRQKFNKIANAMRTLSGMNLGGATKQYFENTLLPMYQELKDEFNTASVSSIKERTNTLYNFLSTFIAQLERDRQQDEQSNN